MKLNVTKGQNIIQLLADDFSSCLVIQQALIVNWPDCQGSVGEYYAISNHSSEEREKLTNELNSVLVNGDENEISKSLETFINLFSNGEYDVFFYTLKINEHSFFKQNQILNSENDMFSGAFYPSSFEIYDVFNTIPNHKINPERVNYYIDLINKGDRPKVLLAEAFHPNMNANGSTYVLDGHYKLEAYLKLKIDIPAVKILKQCTDPNETELILKYIQPTLNGIEFNHYFKNNENILNVDFLSNQNPTEALDVILQNDKNPGVYITKLLINAAVSENNNKNKWLRDRLNILEKNKYIGKGFYLYYKDFDETHNCEAWFQFEINSNEDLKMWLKKVMKIKPNIFDLFLSNYWH